MADDTDSYARLLGWRLTSPSHSTLVNQLFEHLRFTDLPPNLSDATANRLLAECDRKLDRVDVCGRLAKVLIIERRLQANKKLSRAQTYERRFPSEYVRRDMLKLAHMLRKHDFDA